jgi:hypothetical protein
LGLLDSPILSTIEKHLNFSSDLEARESSFGQHHEDPNAERMSK